MGMGGRAPDGGAVLQQADGEGAAQTYLQHAAIRQARQQRLLPSRFQRHLHACQLHVESTICGQIRR